MEPILLEGGTIRTLDPATPTVERLAIAGGRVVENPPADARRIDLGCRCVLPGLNDAHVHFPTWSMAQRQVRLEGAGSLAEAVGRVADRLPAKGWLRGIGWRDADWTDPPTAAALDAVAPDTPVILTSKDYHSLWLNSAALAHAAGDLDAPGGVVELDTTGEPTGILRENAAWRFRDRYAAPSMDEMLDACRDGLRVAAARGVTAIHDKDGWLGSLELFQRLHADGELTLRVWQSIPADRLPHLRELGLRSGFGDDVLRAGYLKVFMDGTLGSATAHLLDGSGVELTSSERLAEIVREAAASGWPVGVHAIGDAANRAALDAFEATAADWRPLGLRQRVEHAQLLDAAELPRFAAIGVAASVQFSHAPSDRDLADRVWEGHPGAYAYRSLHDAGARLVNGSDAPVEELDPLAGIAAGVLRTQDERPPWRPEQAVSIETALEATCAAPAWLAQDEHRRGRLMPGMLADLVILDRDPVTCQPDRLAHLKVVATLMGGQITHVWDPAELGIQSRS
jgi:predicted amidohydrolase YtcJ